MSVRDYVTSPGRHEVSFEPGGHYEFSREQEQVIARLGNRLSWVAAPATCLSLLVLIYLAMHTLWMIREGHLENLQLVALPLFLAGIAVLFMAMGVWTSRAGAAMRQIVATTGRDMEHLMSGLSLLNNIFGAIGGFIKAMVFLTLLALILNLIWAYSGPHSRTVIGENTLYSASSRW
jgi:hypothetical protein